MKSKAALQAIPSALAALGINTIPAGIVLVGGESAETAMVLYFLENILLILFTAARVRILAPAHDEAYNSAAPPDYTRIEVNGRVVSQRRTPRNRGTLLKGYLTFSLSFSFFSSCLICCGTRRAAKLNTCLPFICRRPSRTAR